MIFTKQAYLTSKPPQHELDPVIGLIFPLHGSQLCIGFSQQSRLLSTLFEIGQTAVCFVWCVKIRPEVRNDDVFPNMGMGALSPQGNFREDIYPGKFHNTTDHNFLLVFTFFRPNKWFHCIVLVIL